MPPRSRLIFVTVMLTAGAASALASPASAETAGTISGQVLFRATNRGVTGATVVASSPALEGGQTTVVTNPDGSFELTALPEGTYDVIAYYGVLVARSTQIAVQKWVPHQVNLYIHGTQQPPLLSSMGNAISARPPIELDTAVSSPAARSYQLSSELRFIDQRGAGTGDITDAVVLRTGTRVSVGHVDFSAGLDVLARARADASSDRTFVAARMGVEIGIGSSGAAFVDVEGGPQRFERGGWSTAAVGGLWRLSVGGHLAFGPRLGLRTTSLFNEVGPDQWLAEGFGGLAAHASIRNAGAWVGADLSVPLAFSADAGGARTNPGLDPRIHLGLELGARMKAIAGLDIFAAVSFIERGDDSAPGTTLPILLGGRDQTQIILGVIGRLDPSP